MKKIIVQVSCAVIVISALVYCIGRWAVQPPMPSEIANVFMWTGGLGAAVIVLMALQRLPFFNVRRSILTAGTLLTLLLAAFGVWGLFAEKGQLQFPQASGAIPYAALILSIVIAVCVITYLVLGRQKRKRVRRV